ncbi:unnamed protein product [Schistocephalus solidus]|uniref:Endo/exonuclease/phosphatase domain-containing protein n=1 Tax=Schistocephalus solidus TaxID=70667 RepID=A0A183TUD5_SCHSO|nr:unnamed protein product [Schistocephalus solidus]
MLYTFPSNYNGTDHGSQRSNGIKVACDLSIDMDATNPNSVFLGAIRANAVSEELTQFERPKAMSENQPAGSPMKTNLNTVIKADTKYMIHPSITKRKQDTETGFALDNYRQLRGGLIGTYRIVRARECAPEFAYFFELAGTENLRGHPFKLPRNFVHTDVHWKAFLQRVVGALNGLPDEVVQRSHSLEVLTIYRPPRSDFEADARLLVELERFASRSDVLIMGDFNAPLIDWTARCPELSFD